MRDYLELLKSRGLLKIIDEPCDIDLQIAHLSYLEVKKKDSRALLFTRPTDKNGASYPPVLTNIFGSHAALNLILGATPNDIAAKIEALLKPKKPHSFKEKIDFLSRLYALKHALPKTLKSAPCQEVIEPRPDLFKLPVLKTWPLDAAPFITAGQTYTKPLNAAPSPLSQNLGLYRLQIHGPDELGMHWQIHKDAAHFYHDYERAGRPMPVSIAIGGDPLYFWCAQAPLPKNVFELLLYGFIRQSPAKLVKSITNDIFVPADADYIIEGFVEPGITKIEGPFGDHTGFYTPAEPFAVLKVTAITRKKSPIFHATVVGKPPLEDKYMGYGTERIFLPLLKTTAPELLDYHMPENGVFHNLILAKYSPAYPAAAQQLMHAFWGVGQMSFVKHAIFIADDFEDAASDSAKPATAQNPASDSAKTSTTAEPAPCDDTAAKTSTATGPAPHAAAPALTDYPAIARHILNHLTPHSLLFSHGITDQLDHASPNSCVGGKLGVDISTASTPTPPLLLKDDELLALLKAALPQILELKQHFTDTANPITIIKINRQNTPIKTLLPHLNAAAPHLKIAVFVDSDARLHNLYMLLWRVCNNIDAGRDISIIDGVIFIDATAKNAADNYQKEWPKMTDCDRGAVEELIRKNLLTDDAEFFEKYEIFG